MDANLLIQLEQHIALMFMVVGLVITKGLMLSLKDWAARKGVKS